MLFCEAQGGFIPRRSCMTQILVAIELWTKMLDSGDPVDAICLNFCKMFDTVPHKRLLNKLMAYSLVGDFNDWIRAFLTGHTHQFVGNSSLASWLEVSIGIPPGHLLGPLLFIPFINNLRDMVWNRVEIFADDTKVYLMEQDCVELQTDPTRLPVFWVLFAVVGQMRSLHRIGWECWPAVNSSGKTPWSICRWRPQILWSCVSRSKQRLDCLGSLGRLSPVLMKIPCYSYSWPLSGIT